MQHVLFAQTWPAWSSTEMMAGVAVGSIWLVAARTISRCVDLITLFFLARLLVPADFGLIALAMIVIYIVEAILQLPLYQVLVRIPVVEDSDIDTAFTLSALRGLALLVIACCLSVPIALLYNDFRLVPLISVIGFGPAARGLASPRMALFLRDMNFLPVFLIDVGGRCVASTAAIVTALVCRDYWAIAAGTVTGPLASSLISFYLAPYRPKMTVAKWSSFASYFGWSTLSQTCSALMWQGDRLILGRLVDRTSLGNFSMAADISAIPSQTLLTPLNDPLLSAFAKLRGDREKTVGLFKQVTFATTVVGLPLFVGLSVMSQQVFGLFFGAKWAYAGIIFSWLVLESIPDLTVVSLFPLAINYDMLRGVFYRSAVEMAIKFGLVTVLGNFAGVQGVIAARLVTCVIINIFSMALIKKMIGVSLSQQLRVVWPSALSTCIMAPTIMLCSHSTQASGWPDWLVLPSCFVIGILVYVLSLSCCGVRTSSAMRLFAPIMENTVVFLSLRLQVLKRKINSANLIGLFDKPMI